MGVITFVETSFTAFRLRSAKGEKPGANRFGCLSHEARESRGPTEMFA